MMTGMAGLVMWLMMGLMLLGLATGGVAWLRRRLRRPSTGPRTGPQSTETPEEILRRRYATGEIDRDEYQRRRRDLEER